ncbi:MAG: hypothetical protein LRZ84_17720 [Desertifilum sp.]|nr:hypothetical protein [Desertifilum sp.]
MANEPDRTQSNAAINAAATTKVHHAQLSDLPPNVERRLYQGGLRPGDATRSGTEAQQMLDKIPPGQRVGTNSESAGANTQNYLKDKHASHIQPHSKGGASSPDNLKWEDAKANMARGDRPMSLQEQAQLNAKWHFDNFSGALKAGLKAAPVGAAIGAVTTVPFSMLKNALQLLRGEISPEEAIAQTLKESAMGGAVGGTTALTVTTVAAACPPIAIALTAAAPLLAVVGAAGMVAEFFKILENHKQAVRAYYQSLTQQELNRLQEIEDQLIDDHNKNLAFLAKAKEVNEMLTNRPLEPGTEGTLKHYLESIAIAQSLGLTSDDSPLLPSSQLPLLPSE